MLTVGNIEMRASCSDLRMASTDNLYQKSKQHQRSPIKHLLGSLFRSSCGDLATVSSSSTPNINEPNGLGVFRERSATSGSGGSQCTCCCSCLMHGCSARSLRPQTLGAFKPLIVLNGSDSAMNTPTGISFQTYYIR